MNRGTGTSAPSAPSLLRYSVKFVWSQLLSSDYIYRIRVRHLKASVTVEDEMFVIVAQ